MGTKTNSRPDADKGGMTLGYEGEMAIYRYVAGQRTQIYPDQLTDGQIQQIAQDNPSYFRSVLRRIHKEPEVSAAPSIIELARSAHASASPEKGEKADAPPFKRGDVVTLKSGGMRMTVDEIWFNHSCSDDERGWECTVAHAGIDCSIIHKSELSAVMLTVPGDDSIPF